MSDWLIVGRKEISIQSVTLVNATAKTIDTAVPSGEKWILLHIKFTNADDVNRDVTVTIWNEAAITSKLRNLYFISALTPSQEGEWPSSENDRQFYTDRFAPIVLTAGNTIRVVWASGGASTGGTDADGLVIEYMKYDI